MPTLLPRRRTSLPVLLVALAALLVLGFSAYRLPAGKAAVAPPSACPRAGEAPMPIACVPQPEPGSSSGRPE